MTVIAWDGKTLAADKRATGDGVASTVTKIRRQGGCLLGIAGGLSHGTALLAWHATGAKPENYPPTPDGSVGADLLVITKDKKILVYAGAHPFEITDAKYVIGSGRHYATMAMRLGKNAAEAVALTCEFDYTCGNGVDTLEHAKRGSVKHG